MALAERRVFNSSLGAPSPFPDTGAKFRRLLLSPRPSSEGALALSTPARGVEWWELQFGTLEGKKLGERGSLSQCVHRVYSKAWLYEAFQVI